MRQKATPINGETKTATARGGREGAGGMCELWQLNEWTGVVKLTPKNDAKCAREQPAGEGGEVQGQRQRQRQKECKDKQQLGQGQRGSGAGAGSRGMSYGLWSCGACGANFAGSDFGHAHGLHELGDGGGSAEWWERSGKFGVFAVGKKWKVNVAMPMRLQLWKLNWMRCDNVWPIATALGCGIFYSALFSSLLPLLLRLHFLQCFPFAACFFFAYFVKYFGMLSNWSGSSCNWWLQGCSGKGDAEREGREKGKREIINASMCAKNVCLK